MPRTTTINGKQVASSGGAFAGASALVVAADAPTATLNAAIALQEAMGELIQICDGTDDDVQIQAALDISSSVALSEGTFSLGGSVQMNSDNTLTGCGRGTTITVPSGYTAADPMIWCGQTTCSKITLRDFALDGNAIAEDGIDIIGASDVLIDNVHISDVAQKGINGISAIAITGAAVERVTIQNGSVTDITAATADGYSIDMGDVSYLTINNMYLNSGGSDKWSGIRVMGTSSYITISQCSMINTSRGYGIYISGTSITHVVIADNPVISHSGGASYGGIMLFANISDVIISHNCIQDNGSIGIYVITADNITITGNRIMDDGTGDQDYGIRVDAAATGVFIYNNDLADNVVAAILDDGGTNVRIDNNNGYVGPGETKEVSGDLAAGNANAFCFNWQNPESEAIIIDELIVDVTTAGGTAGSVLDAGSAAATGTHGNDLINGADLNSTDTYVSTAKVKLAANGGATDWICGQILTQNAASLVGKYYIKYRGQ